MIGLLYDVHGNLPALEAVLAHAEGVDGWLLGGDFASFGAWPAEVIERMSALGNATWLRGNWDRWQGGDTADLPDIPELHEALDEVRSALGEDVVARLAALPATHEAGGTFFCHAAPETDMDSFMPTPQTSDDALLAGVSAPRVVFGHTHLAFARAHGDTTLVNPGSVGFPFDGDTRAAYALLHDDGRIEHRRAEYDVEAACSALVDRYGERPWVTGTVARLRAASFSV